MPSTTIDTFLACTIIVAVALIATAFLCSTMQTSINSTKNINKESYLQAIANYIITNPGAPVNWGTSSSVPIDFGLAAGSSTIPFELDIDKITRLNNLNNFSYFDMENVSYFDMENAAKLNNIALGITVSQVMTINITQTSKSANGSNTSFTFTIKTSIDSEPTSASLNYYVANNSLSDAINSTLGIGVYNVTFQIPSAAIGNAMFIVFARASFDDRITSYAIYNFFTSTQESAPSNDILTLTPLNYTLSYTNSTDVTNLIGYVFSYAYQQNLTSVQGTTQYLIPRIIDESPFVIVLCGSLNNGTCFQEWTSYPQVPLIAGSPFEAGSTFEGEEQNVFSYMVTINNVLYKVDISLGDVVS